MWNIILMGLLVISVLVIHILRSRTQSLTSPLNPGELFVHSQPDWIRVDSGTPEMVQKAVHSYSKVLVDGETRDYTVILSRHSDGFLVLTFPEKFPAYSFMNLIGWLDAPPDIKGVTGTQGWYTSPAAFMRYWLVPDHTNPWGDQLIGYTSSGDFILVYQPEIGVCVTDRRVSVEPEPNLSQLQRLARFSIPVPLEKLKSYGNPQFVITHPPDHKWS